MSSTANITKPNNTSNVQYTVKKLDLDGNGKDDHNLVTMYVDGKVVDAKVISTNRIITNTRNAIKQQQVRQNQNYQNVTKNQGTRVIYRNMPRVPQANKPVMVQDKSSLGQYFKTGLGVGAGASLGSMAMGGLVHGIGSMFGFGNDEE